MAYFNLTNQQRTSFNGSMCRFATVETPLELYSFSNSHDRSGRPDPTRPGKFDPMYFVSKSNIIEAIGSAKHPNQVFEYIRHGVALCEDWGNDMSFMFILDAPPGLFLQAWMGLAKFQPRDARSGRSLKGGWLQYIVDIDSLLVNYIVGPIRTRG